MNVVWPTLGAVFNLGFRPVATGRGFRVPSPVGILILNGLGVAGQTLFGSGSARGGERLGMGRERFGKHALGLIRPTIFVPDDLIRDVRHRISSL